MTTHPTRRTVLTVAAFGAVASIAGCASTSAGASGHGATAAPRPSGRRIDATAAFTALEQEFDARLGVQAVETGTGDTVQHRPDERFAFASTVKALAAAAVLQTHSIEALDVVIHYTADDLVAYSPITEQHVDTGMPLREIATAAVQHSDNTAGNLLFAQLGGPAELTAILRGVGDDTISVDRIEPDLNEATPGDPRDTSTPRALTATLSRYVLGDALAQQQRALLNDWLRGEHNRRRTHQSSSPRGMDRRRQDRRSLVRHEERHRDPVAARERTTVGTGRALDPLQPIGAGRLIRRRTHRPRGCRRPRRARGALTGSTDRRRRRATR